MWDYDIDGSDRISKLGVEARRDDTPFMKLYVNTFYRDVQNAFPLRGYRNDGYEIQVLPQNDQTGLKFLANLFHTPNTRLSLYPDEYEFNHSLESFVRETASNLAYFGQLYWEIVTLKVVENNSSTDVLWLARIPGEIRATGQYYRQIIPPNEQHSSMTYVDIPLSKVWKVDIPARFGGVKKQKRIIQGLAEVSDIVPKFMSQSIRRGNMHQAFDIRRYSHNQFAQMARLMRSWGWMSNQWREDETTEYYWVYRQLLFYASLAYLRQYILDQMNDLLKRLQTPYQITVEGLPTEADPLTCIDGLESGELSFNEALRIIYQ